VWQAAICARSVCALEILIDQHRIKSRGKNLHWLVVVPRSSLQALHQALHWLKGSCEVFGGNSRCHQVLSKN